MSKMTNMRNSAIFQHRLLVSVSAAALLSFIYSATAEAGTDTDRPIIWLELGGQLSRVGGTSDPYLPPFTLNAVQHGLISAANLQTPPRYSIDADTLLSFQPENSDWIFSASIQYGRSNGQKHRRQDLKAPDVYFSGHIVFPVGPTQYLPIRLTADYHVKFTERHTILDFQAGKDVGLGMLGHDGTSQLSLGVRIAQLTSKAKFNLRADPNPHLASEYVPVFVYATVPAIDYYQFYKATPEVQREFRGVGPSLSWNGSAAMAGSNAGDAELAFDWGAKAALLFGRQKFRMQHQTTGDRHIRNPFGPFVGQPKYSNDHYVNSAVTVRSHSVIVPNVSGFAGFSLKFPNAKVSVGYRADVFFNAMDAGIDTTRKSTRSFHGPYASISIGIGD